MTRSPHRNTGLTRLRIIADEQHGIAVNGTEYAPDDLQSRIHELAQAKADASFGPDIRKQVSDRKRRKGPRQSTRLRKAQCPDHGYTIRLSARWIAVGLPLCPVCNVPLEVSV